MYLFVNIVSLSTPCLMSSRNFYTKGIESPRAYSETLRLFMLLTYRLNSPSPLDVSKPLTSSLSPSHTSFWRTDGDTGSHKLPWPLLSSQGCPASAVCLVFLNHHSPLTLLCKHFRGQWLMSRERSCQELHCRIPAHSPLPERCAFPPAYEAKAKRWQADVV